MAQEAVEPVEPAGLGIQGGRQRLHPGVGLHHFVFEVAGLCIGHLGHLHHEPDDTQYAAIGRLDVVMVAVDGGLTLDHASVVRIMERLRSSVVIPMHWFGRGTLDRFLMAMGDSGFAVERVNAPSLTLSLRDLPDRPTVMVLEPAFLSEE